METTVTGGRRKYFKRGRNRRDHDREDEKEEGQLDEEGSGERQIDEDL